MSYFGILKKTFRVLLLDEKAAIEISNTPEATIYGFISLVLVGLIASFNPIIKFMPSSASIESISLFVLFVGGILFAMPFMILFCFLFGYSLMHFSAKILGGKAGGEQYFRVMSNVYVIAGLGLVARSMSIPGIAIFLSLWLMIVNFMVLYKIHRLYIIEAMALVLVQLFLSVQLWKMGWPLV